MANRRQRRKRAELRKAQAIIAECRADFVRSRNALVRSNKSRKVTDEERAWRKVKSSIEMCADRGARRGLGNTF